jgi:membrane fusion protein, multidrug efflux system
MLRLSRILLCYCLVLASCHSAGVEHNETELEEPAAGPNITGVSCALSKDTIFNYFISVNGKIKSFQDRIFVAPTGTRLVRFGGMPGKSYAAGSAIAQFDIIAYQHRLQRGELDKFNADKEYQSQLLGYENLLKGMSEAEAEAIRKKLKISTGLLTAEQDIKEASYDLSVATIKAPFSGILANVAVKEGEMLAAGKEMFRLYDPGQLGLEVKVLESDIGLVKKNMPASISPLSDPASQFPAQVEDINPYVDENGMITVILKLNPPKKAVSFRELYPGMNCTGSIHIPGNFSLLVPKEAVVMRSDRAVVFTLENGKAKWNYVVTGRDNGREIEIKEGLIKGKKVITSNNLQLAHDAPVQEITGQ